MHFARSATVGLVLSTTKGCFPSIQAPSSNASRCRVFMSRLIRTCVVKKRC